jgi:hypothetical protein
LLSLSRIVTFVAESTVTANGTPISSVLAYLLPIEIAARKQTQGNAYIYSPFQPMLSCGMEWSVKIISHVPVVSIMWEIPAVVNALAITLAASSNS